MNKPVLNSYQKLAITTVLATLFLIFVGGLVRAAGAGLGCPDWPRCFGMWIPPTTASELPQGFDPNQFNVMHTWLEYVNRLTGVVIGLLITATFLFSLRYRGVDNKIPLSAGLAFVLVLIQGWIGGQVVRSGLSEGMITVHMLLAMFIVMVLLYTAFRAMRERLSFSLGEQVRNRLLFLSVTLLVFVLIQMIFGTQVREMIDTIKNAPDPLPREVWIDQLSGWLYPLHRSFSWAILFISGLLMWVNRTGGDQSASVLRVLDFAILVMILLQIAAGVGMEWLAVPGALQLFHLVGSALLLSSVFLYVLVVWFSESIPARS